MELEVCDIADRIVTISELDHSHLMFGRHDNNCCESFTGSGYLNTIYPGLFQCALAESIEEMRAEPI
jgi:hypothetical protein